MKMIDMYIEMIYDFFGNILATENQQAIINDIIDVKAGVYLHKT